VASPLQSRTLRPVERSLDVRLAPTRGAPALARRALDRLRGSVPDDVLADLRLVASEFVANAVLHAGLAPGQVIELGVRVAGGRTRLQVDDPGRGFGPRPLPDPDAERIRGLVLVEAIASRWGISRRERTRVWAELDHDRPADGA
jgi:anti-sigma regulatory factor (Ser/Thr protein kinase)